MRRSLAPLIVVPLLLTGCPSPMLPLPTPPSPGGSTPPSTGTNSTPPSPGNSATPPAPVSGTTPAPAVGSSTPASDLKAGYVVGKATDSAGRPLAGVKLRFTGNGVYGGITRLETTTGADGRYELEVGTGPIELSQAYLPIIYEGRNFALPLDPTDGPASQDAFDGAKGKVEDFVLKISGQIDPRLIESTNYYGGLVILSWTSKLGADPVPDGTSLTLTFQPVGPLVDGSTGQVVTRTVTYPVPKADQDSVGNPAFKDVPIGKYTVTARMKDPSGKETPLTVSMKEGDELFPAPAASPTFTFETTLSHTSIPVSAYSQSGAKAAFVTLYADDTMSTGSTATPQAAGGTTPAGLAPISGKQLFSAGFEDASSLGSWTPFSFLGSLSWRIAAGGAENSAGAVVVNDAENEVKANTSSWDRLATADPIDLSQAVSPRVRFWVKNDATPASSVTVKALWESGGLQRDIAATFSGTAEWTAKDYDLSTFKGTPGQLVFEVSHNGNNGRYAGALLDNVTIYDPGQP